jgi:secreted PhoX family phosphatase
MSRTTQEKLIDAAPELLAVLKNLLLDDLGRAWIDSDMSQDDWDDQVDKAKQDGLALIKKIES